MTDWMLDDTISTEDLRTYSHKRDGIAILLDAADVIDALRAELAGAQARATTAEQATQAAKDHARYVLHGTMAEIIGIPIDQLIDSMWLDDNGQFVVTETMTQLRAERDAALTRAHNAEAIITKVREYVVHPLGPSRNGLLAILGGNPDA